MERPLSMMSSTISTALPCMSSCGSLRIVTTPEEDFWFPHAEGWMKARATAMVMLRTRSVAKNTAPFRTQRAMSSWPAKSASISLPISATRRSMSCRLINVVCAIRGRILSQVSPMSVAEIGALHARYVRMSDRFKSLWTYHQFAAGVYKNFLGQALPYAVDFQKMFESIKAIGGTINAAQAAAAQAALAANEQALDRVYRQILA